jgi:hypothetical protein
MSPSPRLRTIIVLACLLLSLLTASPDAVIVSADCEDELALTEAELNTTQRELEQVRKERDDYAQRLEDSTTILIIVLFLLVGSYFVFYLNHRRAKIALVEYQKRMGIDPGTRPKRRRRG